MTVGTDVLESTPRKNNSKRSTYNIKCLLFPRKLNTKLMSSFSQKVDLIAANFEIKDLV